MKKLLLLIFTSATFSLQTLTALDKGPWAGEFFESRLSLDQSRKDSRTVDTAKGKVTKRLYNNTTSALFDFTPTPRTDIALELDLTQTQQQHYGFDAIFAKHAYQWLDDMQHDFVSFATKSALSLSPKRRLHDLSSNNHAPVQALFTASLGKEFVYTVDSFLQAWLDASMGFGSTGSPWLVGTAHLDYTYKNHHAVGLFYHAEKGLSSNTLTHIDSFRSWAHVGYAFQEVGISYRYKDHGFGSGFCKVSKRIYAHMCQEERVTLQVGVIFPLDIFG